MVIRTALTRQDEGSLLPLVLLDRNPTRIRLRIIEDLTDDGRGSVLDENRWTRADLSHNR